MNLKRQIETYSELNFSQWYDRLRNVSIKGICVVIDFNLVNYFLSDSIVIKYENETKNDCVRTSLVPCFPQLIQKVERLIENLGGQVFPKTNFSSPFDASWINIAETCCRNFNEIVSLFRSSDRIACDLCETLPICSIHVEIVLKPWYNIKPDLEFRCFVSSSDLVGVCLRNNNQQYSVSLDEKSNFESVLTNFFIDHFCLNFPLSSFTYDICLVSNCSIVKLLDCNPWGDTSNSLSFDWTELNMRRNNSISKRNLFKMKDEKSPCKVIETRLSFGIPHDLTKFSCIMKQSNTFQ